MGKAKRTSPGAAAAARAGRARRTGHYDVVTADTDEVRAAANRLALAEARLRQANASKSEKAVRAALVSEAQIELDAARAGLDQMRIRLRFRKALPAKVDALKERFPVPDPPAAPTDDGDGEKPDPTSQNLTYWPFMAALACLLAHEAGDDSMDEQEWIAWLHGSEPDHSDGWDPSELDELYTVLTDVQARPANADLPKD